MTDSEVRRWLRVLYDEIGERGPMMTGQHLAELVAIRTAWEVRR